MRPDSQQILIVEDEQVSRAVLAAYLKNEGYNVSEAADGDEMDRALRAGGTTLYYWTSIYRAATASRCYGSCAAVPTWGSSLSPPRPIQWTESWG